MIKNSIILNSFALNVLGVLRGFALWSLTSQCISCSSQDHERRFLESLEIRSADSRFVVCLSGLGDVEFDQIVFRSVSYDDLKKEKEIMLGEGNDRDRLLVGNLEVGGEDGLTSLKGAFISNKSMKGLRISFPESIFSRTSDAHGAVRDFKLSGEIAEFRLQELRNGGWELSTATHE